MFDFLSLKKFKTKTAAKELGAFLVMTRVPPKANGFTISAAHLFKKPMKFKAQRASFTGSDKGLITSSVC